MPLLSAERSILSGKVFPGLKITLIKVLNPPGYKVYACVLNKHWGKQIQSNIKEKTRGFIERNIGWKPLRSDTVKFVLSVNNGELYAKLKLGAEEVRVKLEEIENF